MKPAIYQRLMKNEAPDLSLPTLCPQSTSTERLLIMSSFIRIKVIRIIFLLFMCIGKKDALNIGGEYGHPSLP